MLAEVFISLRKLQECEALYQEGFRLVEPGDYRLSMLLRIGYAYVLNLREDFARAEQLLQENLQLSYQSGNHRLTASTFFDLGRIALASHRMDLAEEYLQKSMNLHMDSGELNDLSMIHLYLGKCFAARPDLPAARDQFRQVIKIGKELDMLYLVYWGLANIARTYLDEGQIGKALEISLVLRHCPTEIKIIQGEIGCLLVDLQAVLPEDEIEATVKQAEGELPAGQASANLLAAALEFERE
jgi:tetratricopeptide (TPR) repeat protein